MGTVTAWTLRAVATVSMLPGILLIMIATWIDPSREPSVSCRVVKQPGQVEEKLNLEIARSAGASAGNAATPVARTRPADGDPRRQPTAFDLACVRHAEAGALVVQTCDGRAASFQQHVPGRC